MLATTKIRDSVMNELNKKEKLQTKLQSVSDSDTVSTVIKCNSIFIDISTLYGLKKVKRIKHRIQKY